MFSLHRQSSGTPERPCKRTFAKRDKYRGAQKGTIKDQEWSEKCLYLEEKYITQPSEVNKIEWIIGQEAYQEYLLNKAETWQFNCTDINLDFPITSEELQVVRTAPKSKSSGMDRLPIMEVYQRYGSVLTPQLLQVFIRAMEKGELFCMNLILF